MDELLSTVRSPRDLQGLSPEQLNRLATEMREAMCRLAGQRTAHFASNLGVVELTLALQAARQQAITAEMQDLAAGAGLLGAQQE